MKNLLITAGISLVVALASVFVFSPKSEAPAPTPGAVASPDIMSPYYSVGGVRVWKARTTALIAATTTPCVIQSPAATSTLGFASFQQSVGTTTATTITIAKATTPYATTTQIGNLIPVGAGAQITIVASSTAANINANDLVFAPNTYLVVGVANAIFGATGVGYAPVGSCEAVWTEN